MQKNTTNIFQSSNVPQNGKIKSEPKEVKLCLDEMQIKKILSAGASLTRGVFDGY